MDEEALRIEIHERKQLLKKVIVLFGFSGRTVVPGWDEFRGKEETAILSMEEALELLKASKGGVIGTRKRI